MPSPRSTIDRENARIHLGSSLGPLLPELAQLEWLEELGLERPEGQPWAAGIPAEWCRPGAFPRLKQ